MASKCKTIGVALIAALALSAAVTSSASATEFTASGYPVSFSGSQVEKHKLTMDGFTMECEVAAFSGSVTGPTTTLTITSAYSGCKTAGPVTTVTMNGCDYVLHLPSTGSNATMDLVCPAGQEITIDVGSNPSNPICQIHIPPFIGKSHVNFANNHPGVNTTMTVSGIKASLTDSQPFLCPFNGNTVVESAAYNGMTKLTGTGGQTIDIG